MELNFDKIFKTSMLALKLTRSNPSILRNKKWLTEFIIIYGSFTAVNILIFYSLLKYIEENNFSGACRTSCQCVVHLEITALYGITLFYRENLLKLMNKMKEDYEKAKKSPDSAIMMMYYAKKGSSVSKQWLILCIMGTSTYVVKNTILYIICYLKGDEIIFIPLYELIYPPFIEENKANIITCILLYLIMLYMAIGTCVSYVSFVPLGPMFMLHASGQLELIKQKIDHLFHERSNEEVRAELKCVLQELQIVYNFVGLINDCFSVIYDIILTITVVLLPVATFAVIKSFNNGDFIVEFCAFIIGAFMITATPCYYSELLVNKGEEVRQAIYACGWEQRYDRSIRATLLIILTRCARPIVIRTLFRTVSLETLAAVYQQCYAIFNIMNTMWN